MASGAAATRAPPPERVPKKDHVTAAQVVKVAAGIVIVVAGLKLAKDLLVPMALAAFIAMVCMRPIHWLRRKRFPHPAAIATVLVALVLLVVGIGVAVGGSAAAFTADIPSYQDNFDELLGGLLQGLERLGVDIDETKAQMAFDSKRVLAIVSDVIASLISVLSSFFLILLLVAFMLADAADLPARLRQALGGEHVDLGRFDEVMDSVNGYMWVKTWISFLTGLCIGVFAAIIGLKYPFLWGFLAFVFNYIPNIGSLIAAVPAVLLALLQHGWGFALLTGAGFLVVNNVIGNVLEPRMLGKRMGLTPLVVFISLLLWSWLWGPIGMLLSVPLAMVLKISLESTPDGKPIAALLGPVEAESVDG